MFEVRIMQPREKVIALCTSREAAEAVRRLYHMSFPLYGERGATHYCFVSEDTTRLLPPPGVYHGPDKPLHDDGFSTRPKPGEVDPWTVEGEGENWRVR